MRRTRIYDITYYDTTERLAGTLLERRWPACAGFRCGDWLWLSGESGTHYTIVRIEHEGDPGVDDVSFVRGTEVGLIDVGGYDSVESLAHAIRQIEAGWTGDLHEGVTVLVDAAADHACDWCR